MFKFVVKKVISKAKAVRRVIEGHVHVEALLGDVQVARLPVCQRRNSSGDLQVQVNMQNVLHFTYKVCRQDFPAVATIHML